LATSDVLLVLGFLADGSVTSPLGPVACE
jgi:hypothetical protein